MCFPEYSHVDIQNSPNDLSFHIICSIPNSSIHKSFPSLSIYIFPLPFTYELHLTHWVLLLILQCVVSGEEPQNLQRVVGGALPRNLNRFVR